MNQTFCRLIAAVLACASFFCCTFMTAAAEENSAPLVHVLNKVRTIITTDGELDDQCSLVRCMLYMNTFELEGLISTSSMFHYVENPAEEFKGRASNQRWIDAYAEVYDNLCQHAEGYPTPEYLTSINLEGNVNRPGEMETDTEGSLRIRECILDDRDDLLFLQCWGGTNTVGAALRSIEDEFKDTKEWKKLYKRICDKVQIWIDLDQDNVLMDYILPNWPGIRVIVSYDQFNCFAYDTRNYIPETLWKYLDPEFMTEYIANDSNALSRVYYNCLTEALENRIRLNRGIPEYAFLSEGDTPNFFYILDNGLRSWENPYFGGWAGRYQKVIPKTDNKPGGDMNLSAGSSLMSGLFVETYDNGNRFYPIYRWLDAIQNDFAARMQWCYLPYEEANHEPVVQVAEGLDFDAARGETVTFHVNTYDPDGDDISLSFWQYYEADTYAGLADFTVTDGNAVTLTIPEDAVPGNTIHIVAQAQDNANIPITRYQRVIIHVI